MAFYLLHNYMDFIKKDANFFNLMKSLRLILIIGVCFLFNQE